MRHKFLLQIAMISGVVLLSSAAVGFCTEKAEKSEKAEKGEAREVREHKSGFWKEEEKALGLSQEQQTKMKALREASGAKQKALRDQVKAKRDALRQELDSATPDRAKAEATLKDINALQGEIGSNRVDEIFQVRAILTPEQFQKLHEFHEKNRAKFEERMKKDKMKGHPHSDGERGHGPEGE